MKAAIRFNGCVALAACIIGLNWNRALAQRAAPAQENTPGISLDVVGIKLGMTVRDSMLALKADNPRLTLAPATRQFEGFSDALMSSVTGSEPATPGPNSTTLRAGENVEIHFTMPPNQEVVWGVIRTYSFATAERPSLQNTLEALHKKYGPETVPADPDPRNNTKGIAWVYDGQGRPLGPSGAQLYRTCVAFSNRFVSADVTMLNSGQTVGPPAPAECGPLIIVNASVQAGLDPTNSQWVVYNLGVWMSDGGRYRTALEATRAVILNAAKLRQKKQNDDVNKRGAPKL